MPDLTFEFFAWIFGAIILFGLIVNGVHLVRRDAMSPRLQTSLNLAADVALMAWGATLLMNIGNL